MKVLSPVAGTVRPLSEAPDPVFAAEMVGSGVMIDPDRTAATVISPVAGKLAKVHPHAFAIVADDGSGLLVHLGIDTVGLKGEGFEVVGPTKGRVEEGQEMVRWDPAAIEDKGLSPAVLVCVMDTAPGSVTSPLVGEHVEIGEALFEVTADATKQGRRPS